MINLDVNAYKLYVFDVDGTLYDQKRLRLIMAKRLLVYYALHPFKIRELVILQSFRKMKDAWTGKSSDEAVCRALAEKKGIDYSRVWKIVHYWIYENPLDAVYKTRYVEFPELIGKLRGLGKKVVALSDYPTTDKLKALQIELDGEYTTVDERIGELKPSPRGLKVIMEDFGLNKNEIIMIGDRDDKDGESARRAGCDYLIVNSNH